MGNFHESHSGMFTSNKDDWGTPQDLFDELDSEFHFTLDPATNGHNSKCKKCYTVEQDGLKQDWSGNSVFCNPPYGRSMYDWVKKCHDEAQNPNTTVDDRCHAHSCTYGYEVLSRVHLSQGA